MIRFHDPRAQIGVEIESYGLSYDVRASADTTVALLANGFPDSENFLIQIAAVMQKLVPGLKVKHWNKGNASIPANDEILSSIEASCQTAVAAYGH